MSKIQYTTLRNKPCGYNHSMIKRLRMLETTKGFISASDNKIDVYMYHDTLKIIDVNPSSLSFTDSFNGDTYEQTLSFEIPLINHQFYFHYNILEYINNRYYCIIETTDGKYIVGGYKSGMFPSYTIEENNIIITLKTNATSNNTLISDYISFNEIDYNHCVGIDGECIDGLWTYKLIQRLNLDGSVSNEYYALNGYENDYTDINIVGTYSRFDTVFGIKLTNPLYDCFKQCYISGLPSSLIFKNTGETQCFTIESDCDFTYSYDITIIDVTFNEDTNELCVTSLKMDSSTQIKITTSDGIDRFVNVVIGTVGGEQGKYDRIYRWFYNGETYCLDENQEINCISSVTIPNETITSGICKYHKTEEYISPLCDGNYDFYGYGIGDLISCERIYRWVLSDSELDYYCDNNTYTKYAMEYEEYSDDNGLTWIRTDNKRVSEIILENKSEDCGYNSGNTSGDTNTIYRWVVSDSINDYYCDFKTYTKYAMEYEEYSDNNGSTWVRTGNERQSSIILETGSNDCGYNNGNPSGDTNTIYRWVVSDSINDYYCDYITNTKYAIEYQQYSVDNGLTWLDSKVTRQTNIILETNSKDCGYTSGGTSGGDSSGNTECDNETIAFSWTGTATSFVLNINETEYTATTNPYSATLTELGIDKFTSAKKMFINCHHISIAKITTITSIPCTNNVTDMSSMFYFCSRLTSLDVSHFDTSNVTDMSLMFSNCSNLTSLDVTNFDTSKVTNMRYMFSSCESLTSLDLSNFDTSNVTNMGGMFHYCYNLTSLDLSNFDTSKVTELGGIFSSCPKLKYLDLSNWDISNVLEVYGVFGYSHSLTTIKVTNCNDITISKLQEALTDAGYSSTVANGIITVTH